MEQTRQEQRSAYDLARDLYENPGIHCDFDVIGPVLVQARRELDELTRLAVERAIEREEPWTRIGPALGVTRQAAAEVRQAPRSLRCVIGNRY